MKSEVSEMEEGGDGESKGWERCGDAFNLGALPRDCIAAVLSFTSPRDACRLSLVSTAFKSASESDAVWESFLPSDYQAFIPSSLCFSSKKQLYLGLCENPVLIDGGRKSLSLERGSGKKCYMLSARDLFILWSDNPTYWRWVSTPKSRFEEVAELINVSWFEIHGNITVSMLSPMTNYKAYLVFKGRAGSYGFDFQPVEVSVGLFGTKCCKRTVYLKAQRGRRQHYQVVSRRFRQFNRGHLLGSQASVPPTRASDDQYPKARADGWVEIELGEFFNDGLCVDGELEMSVLEVKGGHLKSGIVIQGIEIRAYSLSLTRD